jgi:hypothetical protein
MTVVKADMVKMMTALAFREAAEDGAAIKADKESLADSVNEMAQQSLEAAAAAPREQQVKSQEEAAPAAKKI